MIDPIGWIIVDAQTSALDWDCELHPTMDLAIASLAGDMKYNDPDWKPFELYDICPVYPAVPVATSIHIRSEKEES